jgi:TPR repeat protein
VRLQGAAENAAVSCGLRLRKKALVEVSVQDGGVLLMKTTTYLLILILSVSSGTSSRAAESTSFSKLTDDQVKKLTFEEIKKMADRGDTDAQLKVAMTYIDKKKNIKEGIKWCQKASDGGNGKASMYLGVLYQNKVVDGTQNMAEAVKWFSKAVDQEDDYATVTLGGMYRNGTGGVAKDPEKAARFLEISSQKNNKSATLWLADMFAKGEGVKKDLAKARELLSKIPEEEIKESDDGRRVLTELEGFEAWNSIEGNLTHDKPSFPTFYISRNVYNKTEKSFDKYYLVTPGKNLIEQQKLSIDAKEDRGINDTSTQASVQTTTTTQDELVSPSRKWKIVKPTDSQWGELILRYRDIYRAVDEKVDLPGAGWGWNPINWNPSRDLFYFHIVIGTTSDREYRFWQFDPLIKKFTLIGGGQSLNLSSDGNWIVWEDGIGGSRQYNQINIYDIEKNKNYLLTNGNSKNCFYKWSNFSKDDPQKGDF